MSHKYTYKIALLGLSSFLFLGCSSTPDTEYVRVTQFNALEKKIEILEGDKTLFEKKYEELQGKVEAKENEKEDEKKKILVIEKSLEKLETDFLEIQENFTNNKELLQTQIQEIDGILQKLEKVKNHYLQNANISFLEEESTETETLKNAPSEEKIGEKKVINLEDEAQKIRDAQKNNDSTLSTKMPEESEKSKEGEKTIEAETIENLRVSFLEEKKSGEKEFLIFSKCQESICSKYLAEKKLFDTAATLPQEEGKEFLLSGNTKFIGEVTGESYFSIGENFSFESALPLPEAGVSVFDGGSNMDNLSQ